MNILDSIEKEQLRELVDFEIGDTIKVHVKIKEGNKERIQVFEGVCVARSGGGSREMFTVRKVSYNVGVEKMFPLHSPLIDKVEITKRGKIRRAKLFYLRGLSGKAARIKERDYRPEKASNKAN